MVVQLNLGKPKPSHIDNRTVVLPAAMLQVSNNLAVDRDGHSLVLLVVVLNSVSGQAFKLTLKLTKKYCDI